MNSIHPARNGKPRLLSGNARAWQWTNYDSQGRPPKSRNTNAFAYDRRGQLTYANLSTITNTYAYDFAGNRTASNDSIWGTTTWNANPLNQYSFGANHFFTFDLDGNLTSINGDTTLFWDARNRLVAISNTAYSATYTYDWRHRRTSSTITTPTSTTRHTFYYDDWNLIYEQVDTYDSATSTWTPIRTLEYFWGPDLSGTLQGAGGIGGLLAVSINNTFYFPCTDNLGNITAYVSESGATVATYEYDAFGNTLSETGTLVDFFPHRFSSKYYDSSSTFYYYGYRYYSPRFSRWITRDPVSERGGVNLYSFVHNCAVSKIDSLGLYTIVPYPKSGSFEPEKEMAYIIHEHPDYLNLLPIMEPNSYFQDSKFRDFAENTPDNGPLSEAEASRIGGVTYFTNRSVSCNCFKLNKDANGKQKTVGYYVVCTIHWEAEIHLNRQQSIDQRRGAYGHEQKHVSAKVKRIDKDIINRKNNKTGECIQNRCIQVTKSLRQDLMSRLNKVFDKKFDAHYNPYYPWTEFEPSAHDYIVPEEGTSSEIDSLLRAE